MTEFLITIGVVIAIAGIFYVLVLQNNQQLRQVDTAINAEATALGLEIRKITYPGTNEWRDSPFEKEIRIGTLGFEGIPYNRQYYRRLKCQERLSGADKTIWVRVTRNYKTRELKLEWREQK